MNLFDADWLKLKAFDATKSVYIKTEPEVLDFTISAHGKLIVLHPDQRIELEITPESITQICGLLDATIFDKTKVETVYAWNFKSLCSYAKFFVGKSPLPKNRFVDLKLIESFLNIRQLAPETYSDAIDRAKAVFQHKGWQPVYKNIHLPLALRVLPSIESTPLLNETTRRPEFPWYDIEGQVNGRMNCAKKFSRCYLPHTMSAEVRSAMKPRGYGLRFVTADFKHCEVKVLQWLSGDPVLKKIIDSGEDVYKQIYEIVTGDACDSDSKRSKSKKMILSLIFGSSIKGLAENLSVSEAVAKELRNRLVSRFSAFAWLNQQQDKVQAGAVAYDYFNRPRVFEDPYKVRNFLVQAVAATVCQEKLIDVHDALNSEKAYLVYSVHDGYGFITQIAAAQETYEIIKRTLEAESKLCPGLKLEVEIKFGAKLDNMKVLWKYNPQQETHV